MRPARRIDVEEPDLTPAELEELERERRERELSTEQIVTLTILCSLPVGIPILGMIFRSLLGVGVNLSILWTVVVATAVVFACVLTALAVPWRRYFKVSFLIAWNAIGYGVLMSVLTTKILTLVGWATVEPKDAGFLVHMPFYPPESLPELPDGREGHLLLCEHPYHRAVMVVGYADGATETDLDRLFRETGGALLGMSLRDAALGSTAVYLDGNPGREFVFTDPSRGTVVMRGYKVGGRVYTLAIMGPDLSPNALIVKKFFGSFKLVKPETPAEY